MEEVEQICTRIMIMDKGKAVATGTKEELKAMIRAGEKLTVEIFDLSDDVLKEIKSLSGLIEAEYDNQMLTARCIAESYCLSAVLDALRRNKVGFGRVFSEPPTLNDVFLEITGKDLKD